MRLSPCPVLVVRKGDGRRTAPSWSASTGRSRASTRSQVARDVWPDAPIVACHVVEPPAGRDRGRGSTRSIKLIERQGDPAGELLAELERGELPRDRLGPRGLGQLTGLLLGSVTEKILQLARRPVLVAR